MCGATDEEEQKQGCLNLGYGTDCNEAIIIVRASSKLENIRMCRSMSVICKR